MASLDTQASSDVVVLEQDASHSSEFATETDNRDGEAEEDLMDQVKFLNMKPAYPASEDIAITYNVGDGVLTTAHDWVGMYKLGWKLPRSDYFTFVWSPADAAEDGSRTVIFTPRYLPKDLGFYQFCYVNKAGEIRGVSSAFQIRTDVPEQHEDLICIDLNEEGLDLDVVLVESRERRAQQAVAEDQIAELRSTVSNLQLAEEDWKDKVQRLTKQVNLTSADREQVASKMADLEARILQLNSQIETLQAEKADAMEKTQKTAALVVAIEGKLMDAVDRVRMCDASSQEAIEEKMRHLALSKEQDVTIAALREQLTSLEAESEENQSSASAAAASSEALQGQLAECRAELDSLQAVLLAKTAEFQDMSAVLAQSRIDECALKQSLDEYKAYGEELRVALGRAKETSAVQSLELDAKEEETARLDEMLRMANARKALDDEKLDEQERESTDLKFELVTMREKHALEMEGVCDENAILRHANEISDNNVQDLRSQVTILQMSIEEYEARGARICSEQDACSAVAMQNLAEVVGENALLKEENVQLRETLSSKNDEIEELKEASSDAGNGARFALKKAFEDSQRKCYEAVADCKHQVRIARAAESAVKVLESEITDLNGVVTKLRQKVQEGGEVYKKKYCECIDLKSQLDELKALGPDGELRQQCDKTVAENRHLREEVLELKRQLEESNQENARLGRETCNQFLQSLRLGTSATAAPTTAPADVPAAVEEPPRYCPVCNVDLPWTMAIEDVQEHCASHFE